MKILVCGSRGFRDAKMLNTVLNGIWFTRRNRANLVLIHGACPRGADLMADNWGRDRKVTLEIYPANWEKYGPAAGKIRNKQMLHQGKPELVIAFFEKEKTGGTTHMATIAKQASIRVWEMYSV